MAVPRADWVVPYVPLRIYVVPQKPEPLGAADNVIASGHGNGREGQVRSIVFSPSKLPGQKWTRYMMQVTCFGRKLFLNDRAPQDPF